MAGVIKEVAMNASSPRKARASLPVRVALIIIAVALVAVAALAVVNLVAANQYNQATQSLIENIKTSQSQTPDLDKLNAQQQQTDAQFQDAASAGALLLPQLREAIKHNSAVSEQLTKRTLKTIKATSNSQNSDTNVQNESSQNDTDKQQSGGNLTEEQRKKVEELLQQNTQSASPDSSDESSKGSATDQDSDSSSTQTKPW